MWSQTKGAYRVGGYKRQKQSNCKIIIDQVWV